MDYDIITVKDVLFYYFAGLYKSLSVKDVRCCDILSYYFTNLYQLFQQAFEQVQVKHVCPV
jgi:hypothetical protein